MSNEEINYWLETFEETRHTFMSKDGKTLSFYDTFKTMKDLQNNWNELKKGLQSLFEFDYGVVSKNYLECAEDTLDKMQELEGNNE